MEGEKVRPIHFVIPLQSWLPMRSLSFHWTIRTFSFVSYANAPSLPKRALAFTPLSQLHPNSHLLTRRQMSTPANEPRTLCIPCASLNEDALLSKETIQNQLTNMPLWSLEETTDGVLSLSRRFTAKHFQAALDALNAMGAIAEREGHHPDMHLTNYREVTISLWTHKLAGLTQNDLTLATMLDSEVNVVYSPKWLQDHPDVPATKLKD